MMDERLRQEVTIGEWLAGARKKIRLADAEAILCDCLAWTKGERSYLVAHDDEPIPYEMDECANDMVRMRADGVPLAYVLGRKEFYGREFMVTPDVLIPRPETEMLIDLVKELELPRRPVMLDVGTGSGCIAITLALEFPQAEVMATDISEAAIEIAERNDRELEGRVMFAVTDLVEGVSFSEDGPFDVVVANLPYVDPEWEWVDKKALRYEPRLALYEMRAKGLGMYKRLFGELEFAREMGLAKYLVLECDPCQQKELMAMGQKAGWEVCGKKEYGVAFVAGR